MKIAVVVQRYGADINGGAELHARYIAEHLARHMQVEVLTTCATDYVTWRNERPAGEETLNGVTIRRFPVSRERDPLEFSRWSERVFVYQHALRDELAWLDEEGPTSPELIAYIRRHEAAFDFFIFFSFRYYHSYHGARAVPGKAMLVPTAERDGALGLAMFSPIFRGVRAIMYNSFEERALIQGVSANHDVPGVVVGVGSEIPEHTSAARFRQKFDLRERFAIYIGRIDENKGCAELFEYFQKYGRRLRDELHLVLIGTPIIPIPVHPRIHHLGYVSDQDKFDALAASTALIMPSYFESLSMVALEAWALGKPVLANGRCDVLRGQCIRSNGGLYYEDLPEFIETLHALDRNQMLATALGRSGHDYFMRNYTWPVIERKYLDMIEELSRAALTTKMERLPWWFARRRNDLPPGRDVVAALPKGPALPADLGRRSDELHASAGRHAPPPARDSSVPPAAVDSIASGRVSPSGISPDQRRQPSGPNAFERRPDRPDRRDQRGGRQFSRPPGSRPSPRPEQNRPPRPETTGAPPNQSRPSDRPGQPGRGLRQRRRRGAGPPRRSNDR